jgi:hypothetical protein
MADGSLGELIPEAEGRWTGAFNRFRKEVLFDGPGRLVSESLRKLGLLL